MASNTKKRKSTKQTPRLNRSDLLPTSPSIASSILLKNHMALAALKTAQGNVHLAGELLKTLYWTFYLSDEETLKEQKENFIEAERCLKVSIAQAADTHTWAVSDADALYIAALLQLHDDQLRLMPVHRLEKAKHRLEKLFAQGKGFPTFAF
jgi:hypothetical protein